MRSYLNFSVILIFLCCLNFNAQWASADPVEEGTEREEGQMLTGNGPKPSFDQIMAQLVKRYPECANKTGNLCMPEKDFKKLMEKAKPYILRVGLPIVIGFWFFALIGIISIACCCRTRVDQ